MHIFSWNKNYYKNWPVKFWYNEGMDICLSVDSQWASKRKEHRGTEERMCSEKNILQVQKLERITADSQSCRGMKEVIHSVKVKLNVWEFFRKSDHLQCLSNDSLSCPNHLLCFRQVEHEATRLHLQSRRWRNKTSGKNYAEKWT